MSYSAKVSRSQSMSGSPSSSLNSRSPGISRTSTASSIITPTLILGRTVNMCTTTSVTLPRIGAYAYIITNPIGGQYLNDQSCSIVLNAPLDSYLEIQSVSFVTEGGYDIFTVYGSSGNNMYRNSGSPPAFTLSTSPPIHLTFTTDGSNVVSGVNVLVTSLAIPTDSVTPSPTNSVFSKSPSHSASSSLSRSPSSSPRTSSTSTVTLTSSTSVKSSRTSIVSCSNHISASYESMSSSPKESISSTIEQTVSSEAKETITVSPHTSHTSSPKGSMSISSRETESESPSPSQTQSPFPSFSSSSSSSVTSDITMQSTVTFQGTESSTSTIQVTQSPSPNPTAEAIETATSSASISIDVTQSGIPMATLDTTVTSQPTTYQTSTVIETQSPTPAPTPSIQSTSSHTPNPTIEATESSRSIVSPEPTHTSHTSIHPSRTVYESQTPSLTPILTQSPSPQTTPQPSYPSIPVLPNLTGISNADLMNLFNDMVYYNPAELADTLNKLAAAGLQGSNEFAVNTSAFALQIKKIDTESDSSLAIGSTAINLPAFGSSQDISAASVIKWTKNPYSSPVDLPVLAINVLSTSNEPILIQNLSIPITMSWPYEIQSRSYTIFCDSGNIYNNEVISLPLVSFGNGTYIVKCELNTTMTLTCKNSNPGTIVYASCKSPTYTPECVYWNKQLNAWRGDGCNASFVNNTIQCKCSHLTDFSTRINSVIQDNTNIFGNAGSIYTIEGLEKYSQWYGVFGGIGILTLILMYIGHSCDRPISQAYTESLITNPIIGSILEKIPLTPLSRYDKNTVYRENAVKEAKEVKESKMSMYVRLILDNSRLQPFFRYDPRLSRMFRILTLFVLQFHSLFVTAFLYGFIHTDSIPVQWYDILFISAITTLFNTPCVVIVMGFMNEIGKGEFIYKYPILYDEYKKRLEFEKYAILYLNKKSKEGDIEELTFLDESDSILENVCMYLCCRMKPRVKEATIIKSMPKGELLNTLLKILNIPYKRFAKYSSWWDFMPVHTLPGIFFLTSSLGWLAWCLNYLLIFASYHSSGTSRNIMISYITSEVTTVFISQPLTILCTFAFYIYLHRHGNKLPWPLSLLRLKHNKRIPPSFYYSNPWNKETNSSLTSELAYTMFVKCPAEASQIDETAYAPFKSILNKLNNIDEEKADTGVKDLYQSLSLAKFERDLARGFV